MPGAHEDRVREFTAPRAGSRLDRLLAEMARDLSRSRVHTLIAEGHACINGSPARPSQRVKAGDRVSLRIPPVRDVDLAPQDIPLNVVYQDAELVVLDKPAGLSVHPGPGHPDGTLVNALLALCPDIKGIGGEHRPGVVHRLDKDTSGLMMVAKTENAHRGLSGQIKNREVRKGYLALTVGVPPLAEGTVDAPIARDPRHRKRMAVAAAGRQSVTRYRVLQTFAGHALLELLLETGRTHQIRVHLAYLGYPLFGDEVYGRRHPDLPRQFLHASSLVFTHPVTGKEMSFTCGLPAELQSIVDRLSGNEVTP